MGALRAENQDLDQARTTWNEIRAILEETGSNANPNKFILHWWLSRDGFKETYEVGDILAATEWDGRDGSRPIQAPAELACDKVWRIRC